MKTKAWIVLAALLLTLTAPFSFGISTSDGIPILVTLDVCNAAGAPLSVNADVPVIQECSSGPVPPAFSGYLEISHPGFFPLIITHKVEHPPEA